MIRLNVVVEGQTEAAFVARLLAPHLAMREVVTAVRCVTCGRKRGQAFKGGLPGYSAVRRDLSDWMREDRGSDARFTTMFDLYALPRGFPGYDQAALQTDCRQRIAALEASLANDFGDSRLVPYLQLHEFEALLLADAAKFGEQYPLETKAVAALAEMVGGFSSPEEIDDGPNTAPSKRIGRLIPRYLGQKVIMGPQIAAAIGLPTMRAKCPHFGVWVTTLENLK